MDQVPDFTAAFGGDTLRHNLFFLFNFAPSSQLILPPATLDAAERLFGFHNLVLCPPPNSKKPRNIIRRFFLS
ncbi:unnamed protein product [Tetraodon nigroviridis]|uniref:(spotted green pufferfish) hypothetical protein n=1 Tax=Tetraodon nigroviridis TaxID=99883 RepID=Q4SSJ7_TETNG|nr:unnamed protein product [Tetraodon nigroviridis]